MSIDFRERGRWGRESERESEHTGTSATAHTGTKKVHHASPAKYPSRDPPLSGATEA